VVGCCEIRWRLGSRPSSAGEGGLTGGNHTAVEMDGIVNLRGLPTWKLAVMAAGAASIVCVALAVAALIFGLLLADKNEKAAIAATAQAQTAEARATLIAAQAETARPTETARAVLIATQVEAARQTEAARPTPTP